MKNKRIDIKQICLIAMMSAVITVCSWLSLPIMTVPVTLQTFAVFLTLLVCGGRIGTLSILVYILLGLVGAPVFSGFKGGAGALFSLTGGYIIGFLFMGIIYLITEKLISESQKAKIISLVIGLFVCYAFGTVWFVLIYNEGESAISVKNALTLCVLPFIIPDLIKLVLSVFLSKLLKTALEKVSG